MLHQQPQFKTFTYTVSPNGQAEVARSGSFVNCLAANGPFQIAFNDGTPTEFSAGLVYDGNVPFDRLRLFNRGASAVTVKLAIGAGGVRDTRLVLDANALKTEITMPGLLDSPAPLTVPANSSAEALPADARRSASAIQMISGTELWVRSNGAVAHGGLRLQEGAGVILNTTAQVWLANLTGDMAQVTIMSTLYEV